MGKINRREFMGRAVSSASFFLLMRPVVAKAMGSAAPDPEIPPHLDFFSPLERKALGYLTDHVFPGAVALGSVIYIESLLMAFDSDPPRIFAGGPFSGRGGKAERPNDFEKFLPLNRHQELAWRLRLYGDAGAPGGVPNKDIIGPRPGLREIIGKGVSWTSRQIPESGLVTKPTPIATLFGQLDADCRKAIQELTLESCFAAPEYGGNRNAEGWRLIQFGGDSAPYGYSHYNELTQSYEEDPNAPVSRANPGTDAEPLGWGTRTLFAIISRFTKGRQFY